MSDESEKNTGIDKGAPAPEAHATKHGDKKFGGRPTRKELKTRHKKSEKDKKQKEKIEEIERILAEIRNSMATASSESDLKELRKRLIGLRGQASLLPSFPAEEMADIDSLLEDVSKKEEKERIKQLNQQVEIHNSPYQKQDEKKSPQEIDLDVINKSKEACIKYANAVDDYYLSLSSKFDILAKHSRRLKENPELEVNEEEAEIARFTDEEIKRRMEWQREKEKAERSNEELYDRAMDAHDLLGKLNKKDRSLHAREQVLRGERAIYAQRGQIAEKKIATAKIDVVVKERSKVKEQIRISEERFDALAEEHAANTEIIESKASKLAKIAQADKQREEILARRVKTLEKQQVHLEKKLQALPRAAESTVVAEAERLQEKTESEKQSILAEMQAAEDTGIDLQAEAEKKKAREAKKAKLAELRRKRAAKKAAERIAGQMVGPLQNTTNIKPPATTPAGLHKPQGPSK